MKLQIIAEMRQARRAGRILTAICAAIIMLSCSPRSQTGSDTLYVSILPLRGIVEEIVGNDFKVETLVPPGASPETFEPTARQAVALNKARLIFNVGLIDFEATMLAKIDDSDAKIVNLSKGITLLEGTCSHHSDGHHHAHGIDPHIWTSPRALQQMARNAYDAIHRVWPDSAKYTAAHERLQAKLRALDERTAEKIERSGVRYFIIYHPAFTYYARDYGLRQVAIEADGKEPSAKQLSELIKQAREDKVDRILYQKQFPASVIKVIAADIGAQCVEIDPLQEDVVATIDQITDLITDAK